MCFPDTRKLWPQMAVSLPFLPIPTMPKYRSSKWQSFLFQGHLATCPQGVWFLPGALLNPKIKICLSRDLKYPQDRVLQRQLRWNGAGTGLLTLTNYSLPVWKASGLSEHRTADTKLLVGARLLEKRHRLREVFRIWVVRTGVHRVDKERTLYPMGGGQ